MLKKKTKQKSGIIFIFILILILLFMYRSESISEDITVLTAIFGAIAIWYQLRKDQQIATAEFIVTLNNTFNDNDKIIYIYDRLKALRDNSVVDGFTSEDGRKMGDYIMFFQIIDYLLDERIIKIDMIDKLFANKFFIFVNNLDVQKYQLKYNAINSHVFELYVRWFNYRRDNKLPLLYSKHQFHLNMPEYFESGSTTLKLKKDFFINYEEA